MKEREPAVRYPLIALVPNCVIYRVIRPTVAGPALVYQPVTAPTIVSNRRTSSNTTSEIIAHLAVPQHQNAFLPLRHRMLPETRRRTIMNEGIPQDNQNNTVLISRGSQILTIGLLVVSVALNVALSRRNKALSTALFSVKAEQSLPIGSTLPPIEAFDLAHHLQVLKYDPATPPTVFYVFSPQCGWCAKNAPNLRVLSESIRGRYRLIGLSLSSAGLDEYVAKQGMDFPIYTNLSPQSVAAYRLGGTPTTIVVSAEGKLLREWKGAYMGSAKHEIEEYFGVSVPGVTQANE